MRSSTIAFTSPFCDTAAERLGRFAAEARGARCVWQSPAVGGLYRSAIELGRRLLRRFRGIDGALAEDLTSGLLLRALPEIVAADRPQAFFAVALRREAISWTRRRAARVEAWSDAAFEGPADAEERAAIRRIDAARWLVGAGARERAVLLAITEGQDREDIARGLGTSRANVDQIVHRARARASTAATAAP